MGGEQERIITDTAARWQTTNVADLNTIAIACPADLSIPALFRLAGLPDAAYHHDEQVTKREIRAVTLAA
ncbi:MAG: hypothetical protein KME35_21690 [Aphanocapsa sp. GSE-SYN-MK-11-07L]|jgi:precorrin-6Y C5,15-methyltransferase (decarboxylating)|nr:hypothetical protein [Aphanocapsa sp. GSE-SYN-MK-11-07L]